SRNSALLIVGQTGSRLSYEGGIVSPILRQRPPHDRLRLKNDGGQVFLALEALGVELVDVLGARRAGGKPAVGRRHLQPADGCPIAWRRGQFGRDRLAGQLARRDRGGRQGLELLLFLRRGGGVD